MTKRQQRQLLREIQRNITKHLMAQSARWPKDWDGHELRELLAKVYDYERTSLMRRSANRRQECLNTIIIENLD